MSTYATLDDVALYGVVVENTDEAQSLLDRAEREVDNLVTYPYGPLSTAMRAYPLRDETTGLRLNPDALLPYQRAALTRAVAAQFEYHIAMGEDFFRLPQPAEVTQPEGGGYKGALQRVGPKALRELEGTDLLNVSGTAQTTREAWGMLDWQRDLR